MSIFKKLATATVLFVATGAAAGVGAQEEEDLFAFIPQGGRTLLAQLVADGHVKAEEVMTERRSREDWFGFLQGLGDTGLDSVQQETLAAYLAATMPAAEVPGQTIDTDGLALPRDGRDLTLEYCQSCHIITVVVTQDRSREAWLGTMNKPSHVEIDNTQQEREALADYLVLNGGISIDDVPEELRAGGASY